MSQTPFRARASLRLAALVAGTVIALSLCAMALQYRLVARELRAGQVALLRADLDGLAALYDQRRIIALRQALEYRTNAGPGATGAGSGERLLLLDKSGIPLAGNLAAWPEGLPTSGSDFSTVSVSTFALDGAPHTGVARLLPGGFALLVARPLAGVEATLAALRRSIGLVVLAMLAVASAVGWIAARGIMGRIDRINRLADRVAAGALDARLPGPRSPDEFGLLERHVHGMLDRIQNLNRATYRLSDTIAHELRTPLGRIMAKLGRITGQPDVVGELRGEMRSTIRIFDSLLDISRAEADAGTAPGLVPVDLSAVATEVLELYEPVAEDKGLAYSGNIAPGVWVLGDRNLIAQLISNLLDNAIKFTPSGQSVALALTDGDTGILRVADTGPGVPEDIREAAFERFVRAERDREVAGHGLGLALVRAIALRHGAKLALPAVTKGFAIEIAWPKVAPPDPATSDPE